MITITIEENTIAKLQPLPSDKLTNSEKCQVVAGSKWNVHSYDEAEGKHIKVALLNASLPFNGGVRNTVYFFTPHISLEGNLPDNKPNDRPASTPPAADTIRVPGITAAVGLIQPIIAGGNFTWDEATHSGTRIPINESVTGGIIRVAKAMQEVRELLGDRTITINSWYRDPATNERVGGASQSTHIQGHAVDFVVKGIHPYDVFDRLDGWWGDRGGLASSTVFTHIDCRGWRARWSYGF